jgi:1-acyl-sn-glycerol-3-phosphate acyltransferase
VTAPRTLIGRASLFTRLSTSALLITLTAIAILPLAAVTLFSARRLYAAIVTRLARVVLRVCGVRVRLHQDRPFPSRQTVYVSNHSSTIDLFVLVALGLPNTRFFLWGRVQRFIPLAVLARLMGTFFTVTQDRTAERRAIFAAADRTLRHTRESVYLSPEGVRVTTGAIGPFNKGTFHLATSLHAPIVPLYFFIPRDIDPGKGFDARPGVVDVYVKPTIDTRAWRLDDLVANKERVRALFVEWHREAHQGRDGVPCPSSAHAVAS